MARLTEYHCNVAVIKDESKLSEAMAKLAHYEDLEDGLFKVYGECEGLIDKAVEGITGIHLGACRKATLLTNEDADKWEHLKDLEEQGLLLRLPCKVGDIVYSLESGKVVQEKATHFIIKADGIWVNNKHWIIGRLGVSVFPTKAEAEDALKKMEMFDNSELLKGEPS